MRVLTYAYVKSQRLGHIIGSDGQTLCGRTYRGVLDVGTFRVCGFCRSLSDPMGRLMAQVEKIENGCWIWTGGVSRGNGYGRAWLNGQTMTAHGAVYTAYVGAIPTGREVDHLCHNRDPMCPGGPCMHRRCVNPEHLEAVTASTNQVRQGARKTHCPHGHEYTPENTKYKAGSNCRHCRACHRNRERRRREAVR